MEGASNPSRRSARLPQHWWVVAGTVFLSLVLIGGERLQSPPSHPTAKSGAAAPPTEDPVDAVQGAVSNRGMTAEAPAVASPTTQATVFYEPNATPHPRPQPGPGTELIHAVPTDVTTDDAQTAGAHLKAAGASAAAKPAPQQPRILWMQVTAYCGCKKCCGPNAHGVTASGRNISYNDGEFVAADTDLLPFGTQLQIPGYAGGDQVEVIDRGSAIRGHRLDVYFPTHEQAKAWGSRWMAVTVLPLAGN